MATQTTVTLVDDIDGTPAEESIEFSLDGVTFEIDLIAEHAEEMRGVFDAYVNAGRRVGGRQKLGTRLKPVARTTTLPAQKAPITAADRHAIQRFAEENGLRPPAERGRIAIDVLAAWEEAGRPH